jgi:hypothetical protein
LRRASATSSTWSAIAVPLPDPVARHDSAGQGDADPTQGTAFHAGDVWKTVLCANHYRRDLDIFTIATPWSGLTVVTGLDPGTEVLSDSYQEAVARFVDLSFSTIENNKEDLLNVVPNDWDVVRRRLCESRPRTWHE